MTRADQAYDELLDQYRDRPRILAILSIVLSPIGEIDATLADLLTRRSLDTAEGVWLDLIGLIVGLDRPTEFVPIENLFTVEQTAGSSDDPDLGFADGPPATFGGYLTDPGGIHLPGADPLSDDDFRVLLRARIAARNASPSEPSIGRFVSETFGVSFEMTVPAPRYIEIRITEAVSPIVIYAIYSFAPIAAGVMLYVYPDPEEV